MCLGVTVTTGNGADAVTNSPVLVEICRVEVLGTNRSAKWELAVSNLKSHPLFVRQSSLESALLSAKFTDARGTVWRLHRSDTAATPGQPDRDYYLPITAKGTNQTIFVTEQLEPVTSQTDGASSEACPQELHYEIDGRVTVRYSSPTKQQWDCRGNGRVRVARVRDFTD